MMKRIELLQKIANNDIKKDTIIKVGDTLFIFLGEEYDSLRYLDDIDKGIYFSEFYNLNNNDVEIKERGEDSEKNRVSK